MSVLCADVWCWARCSHVVLCSYDSRGGSRFTYCMLTNREEDICCSSSTTRHSIQLIAHSYPFPLLRGNNLPPQKPFLVLKLYSPLDESHLVGVSILSFPFFFWGGEGKVHLVATWP